MSNLKDIPECYWLECHHDDQSVSSLECSICSNEDCYQLEEEVEAAPPRLPQRLSSMESADDVVDRAAMKNLMDRIQMAPIREGNRQLLKRDKGPLKKPRSPPALLREGLLQKQRSSPALLLLKKQRSSRHMLLGHESTGSLRSRWNDTLDGSAPSLMNEQWSIKATNSVAQQNLQRLQDSRGNNSSTQLSALPRARLHGSSPQLNLTRMSMMSASSKNLTSTVNHMWDLKRSSTTAGTRRSSPNLLLGLQQQNASKRPSATLRSSPDLLLDRIQESSRRSRSSRLHNSSRRCSTPEDLEEAFQTLLNKKKANPSARKLEPKVIRDISARPENNTHKNAQWPVKGKRFSLPPAVAGLTSRRVSSSSPQLNLLQESSSSRRSSRSSRLQESSSSRRSSSRTAVDVAFPTLLKMKTDPARSPSPPARKLAPTVIRDISNPENARRNAQWPTCSRRRGSSSSSPQLHNLLDDSSSSRRSLSQSNRSSTLLRLQDVSKSTSATQDCLLRLQEIKKLSLQQSMMKRCTSTPHKSIPKADFQRSATHTGIATTTKPQRASRRQRRRSRQSFTGTGPVLEETFQVVPKRDASPQSPRRRRSTISLDGEHHGDDTQQSSDDLPMLLKKEDEKPIKTADDRKQSQPTKSSSTPQLNLLRLEDAKRSRPDLHQGIFMSTTNTQRTRLQIIRKAPKHKALEDALQAFLQKKDESPISPERKPSGKLDRIRARRSSSASQLDRLRLRNVKKASSTQPLNLLRLEDAKKASTQEQGIKGSSAPFKRSATYEGILSGISSSQRARLNDSRKATKPKALEDALQRFLKKKESKPSAKSKMDDCQFSEVQWPEQSSSQLVRKSSSSPQLNLLHHQRRSSKNQGPDLSLFPAARTTTLSQTLAEVTLAQALAEVEQGFLKEDEPPTQARRRSTHSTISEGGDADGFNLKEDEPPTRARRRSTHSTISEEDDDDGFNILYVKNDSTPSLIKRKGSPDQEDRRRLTETQRQMSRERLEMREMRRNPDLVPGMNDISATSRTADDLTRSGRLEEKEMNKKPAAKSQVSPKGPKKNLFDSFTNDTFSILRETCNPHLPQQSGDCRAA